MFVTKQERADTPEKQIHLSALVLSGLTALAALCILLAALASVIGRGTVTPWLMAGLGAVLLILALFEAAQRQHHRTINTRAKAKNRQEAQNDLEMLLSATPTAALFIDLESLEILQCNDLAEKLIGCTRAEIITQPIGAFFDALQENNKLLLDAMRVGREEREEKTVILLDVRQAAIEVQASTRRFRFAGKPAFLMVLTNLSEIKKAQEALQYHATFDEMTSLVNRHTGLLLLEKEMARSQRDATPLAVAFVDLDGLKTVNDQFGIPEGDWLIVKAAEILAESIRLGDEAIRLGGDEFLLVLHNCPEDGSRLLLQRIEERMAQAAVEAQKPFPLVASMGLAIYDPTRHAQVHQLIAEADRRMYLAKQLKKAPQLDFA
jgi:diguanylate cyclase (GGDEF)-like protein/PAS domain S-box-containing protein